MYNYRAFSHFLLEYNLFDMADNGRGNRRDGREQRKRHLNSVVECTAVSVSSKKRKVEGKRGEDEGNNAKIGGASTTLYEGHSSISKNELQTYTCQGSRICTEEGKYITRLAGINADECVLLQRFGRSKVTLLEEIRCIDVECTRKAGCAQGCNGSCKRFAAYQLTAKRLHLERRTPLPACVRWVTEKLHGSSLVGYKD